MQPFLCLGWESCAVRQPCCPCAARHATVCKEPRCCLTFLQKWPACSLRLVCSLLAACWASRDALCVPSPQSSRPMLHLRHRLPPRQSALASLLFFAPCSLRIACRPARQAAGVFLQNVARIKVSQSQSHIKWPAISEVVLSHAKVLAAIVTGPPVLPQDWLAGEVCVICRWAGT